MGAMALQKFYDEKNKKEESSDLMGHEDVRTHSTRKLRTPGATTFNTEIPSLVCGPTIPENPNASNEVTSSEVTDEITEEDSDDYTDDFDVESEDPANPENWDEELSSSKLCVLQLQQKELEKL